MADEVLKQIYCPLCGRRIDLLRQDFTVTTDNERGHWSCDPAIVCPWEGCGVEFFITHSQVEYYEPK